MHDLVTNQSKTFVHRGTIDTLDFVYSSFFGAPATESGVFFSNGEVWKRNRHALMMILNKPDFKKRTTMIFNTNADALVSQWKQSGAQKIELMDEMIKFSTDAIGELCYSTNFGAVKGKFVESFIHDVRFLLRFVNIFLYAPMFTLKTMKFLAPILPFMGRFKDAVENLRRRGETMLAERKEERAKGLVKHDMLDHLLEYAASSDQSSQITAADVNSILFDVVGAGHDSVSNLFATTLAQLAANPNYQERLHHEIKNHLSTRSDNSQLLDDDDLRQLPFLDCVIREALRLYPSGAITVRMASEDTIVGGHHIPAGTQLVLLPYGVQRHPDHWDEPEVFKPERWATSKYRVNNLAYIPFGGGARSCLGSRFATNEAKIIVAKIILNFKVEPMFDTETDLDSQVQFTLRPASALPVRVIPRTI
jgi:cytochrome P450